MKKKVSTAAILSLVLVGFCLISMSALNKAISIENFGIPVTVSVPEGAEVKKGMMGGEVDGVKLYNVEIKKGNFMLDVSMLDEESEETLAESIESYKEIAAEDDDFSSFVAEEANGFIYEMVVDGEKSYGFDYILEKDDRHIEFTQGLSMEDFTMAEVKAMFAAAKSAH